MMNDLPPLYLPAELAELLHAMLGPLAETLSDEGHRWAPAVKRVLAEYISSRDSMLSATYGSDALPEIYHLTYLASERVCELTQLAMAEELDFIKWDDEVDGGERGQVPPAGS